MQWRATLLCNGLEVLWLSSCIAGTERSARAATARARAKLRTLLVRSVFTSPSQGGASDSLQRTGTQDLLYLGDKLPAAEAELLWAHISGCAHCRNRFDEQRWVSSVIQQSRPLYTAPAGLRKRVSAALREDHTVMMRIRAFLPSLWRRPLIPLGAAALLAIAALPLGPTLVGQARNRAFARAAFQAHRAYVDGNLQLEIRSGDTAVVISWIERRVSFRFPPPRHLRVPQSPGVYQLLGPRLVDFRGRPAAMVTYAKAEQKVSLLAASNQATMASGGDELRLHGLTFHEHTDTDLMAVTWSSHGVTDALVSSGAESPQHPCLVCRQNMADSKTFQARLRIRGISAAFAARQ